MKLKKNLNIIFVSALLGCTLILILAYQATDNTEHNVKLAKLMPEFVVLNGISSEFNQKGQLTYKMSATQLSYYLHNNFSELIEPEVKIRDKESKVWIITAERGLFKGDTSLLELSDSVYLRPEPSKTKVQSTGYQVTTDALTLDTQSTMVETDQLITVKAGRDLIQSHGLSADLNKGIVKLHSKITGKHLPNS